MHFDPVTLVVPSREEMDAWDDETKMSYATAFEERIRMGQTLKAEIRDAIDGKILFIEHIPTGERISLNVASTDPNVVKVLQSVKRVILTLQNLIATGDHGPLLKATYDARTNLDAPVRSW